MTLLKVRGLRVEFGRGADVVKAVDGVDLTVAPGEALGVVGASGSGKTVTALTLLGLLPRGTARVDPSSSILLEGQELVGISRRRWRAVRGRRIAMVFQEPMTSLNPVMSVGRQVAEAVRVAGVARSRGEAWASAVELLREVGIPDPEERARDLPGQLSGGMRQRVGIAMALAPGPKLLVADEPTTALDVTIQAQILDLLSALVRSREMALLLISHDLGVVAQSCRRVVVMDRGQVVEEGEVDRIFSAPHHPVSRALVRAVPRIPYTGGAATTASTLGSTTEKAGGSSPSEPILEVRGLVKHYPRPRSLGTRLGVRPTFRFGGRPGLRTGGEVSGDGDTGEPGADGAVRAVDGVSLTLHPGQTLALVGESGAGKSTVARCLIRLVEPDGGKILFLGEDVRTLSSQELRRYRSRVQLVFQDPAGSLNPRLPVGAALEEVLRVHGLAGDHRGRVRRVLDLLDRVGLPAEYRTRLPHQLSGGERQRLGIARALAVEPRVLICDEPVSSLDVHVRRRILDLLMALQVELDLACLLIAHDLGVVAELADRVAVLYFGRVLEEGPAIQVLEQPFHPYTRALVSTIPPIGGGGPGGSVRGLMLPGEPPSAVRPPSGCRYRTRCGFPGKDEACGRVSPELKSQGPNRRAACIKLETAGRRE